MKQKNSVHSVFGEIECITARQMMAEGKGVKLLYPTDMIPDMDMLPPSTRFNELGQQVRIVVVMNKQLLHEWEKRIAAMRW